MKFKELIVFVGSDKIFAIELLKTVLIKKISVKAMIGETSNEIYQELEKDFPVKPKIILEKNFWNLKDFRSLTSSSTLGINFGFEKIIPESVLHYLKIINLHPSYLPFNRGSHQSFWALLEDTTIGATVHWINRDIDAGPILYQTKYLKDKYDTADSVQRKCKNLLVNLVDEKLLEIMMEAPAGVSQDASVATHHYKKEIQNASIIRGSQIDVSYLLRLLKATSHPKGRFYLEHDQEIYEFKANQISVKNLGEIENESPPDHI